MNENTGGHGIYVDTMELRKQVIAICREKTGNEPNIYDVEGNKIGMKWYISPIGMSAYDLQSIMLERGLI